MEHNLQITVLGDGAWGTAWANMLAGNGYHVKIWCYNQIACQNINRDYINKLYLPNISLNKNIKAYTDLSGALSGSHWICLAIPVKYLSEVLEQSKAFINKNQKWMILSKGIEPNKHLLVSDLIIFTLGFKPKLVVVAGPSFAQELALNNFTGLTIASKSFKLATEACNIIKNKFCILQLTNDIVGIQVSSIFKNLIAVGLGIISGQEKSENSKALFLTIIFQELKKIIRKFGGKSSAIETFAGIGDIVLTGYSTKSKNYSLGLKLSNSFKHVTDKLVKEIEHRNYGVKVAEAENTAKVFLEIENKLKIDAPRLRKICRVILCLESSENFLSNIINQ